MLTRKHSDITDRKRKTESLVKIQAICSRLSTFPNDYNSSQSVNQLHNKKKAAFFKKKRKLQNHCFQILPTACNLNMLT